MATGVHLLVLIVAMLGSARLGACAPDWLAQLNEDIHAMTSNIQRQVDENVRALNSNIQRQVDEATRNVDEATRNVDSQINEMLRNLPRDGHGQIITSSGGNSVSISTVNGVSIIKLSGRTQDGEPYERSINEYIDGNYLYHNEILSYPRTNSTQKIRWKLNLKAPGAKPEIITDEE